MRPLRPWHALPVVLLTAAVIGFTVIGVRQLQQQHSLEAWIEGTYRVHGSTAFDGNTTRYEGTATISRASDGYHIVWTIGENGGYDGVAHIRGNRLRVTWHENHGRERGIVIYRAESPGYLRGHWRSFTERLTGEELLTR